MVCLDSTDAYWWLAGSLDASYLFNRLVITLINQKCIVLMSIHNKLSQVKSVELSVMWWWFFHWLEDFTLIRIPRIIVIGLLSALRCLPTTLRLLFIQNCVILVPLLWRPNQGSHLVFKRLTVHAKYVVLLEFDSNGNVVSCSVTPKWYQGFSHYFLNILCDSQVEILDSLCLCAYI